MTIIKLTHSHRELRETKISFSWWRPIPEISFDYVKKWDEHPTFHTVNNCSFTAATNNIDGQEVKGSIFNGYFVKETPEEILLMIRNRERVLNMDIEDTPFTYTFSELKDGGKYTTRSGECVLLAAAPKRHGAPWAGIVFH